MTHFQNPIEFNDEFGSKPTTVHCTWVFTLNNYSEGEFNTLRKLDCTRQCIGKEIAETGTPHLQGFIAFPKGYRLSGLKKINGRACWLRCKSPMHAWNYCLKEGDWYTIDNRQPGHRTDVTNYRDAIKAGATDKDLCDQHPGCFLRYSRTNDMRSAYQARRSEMTECHVYLSPTLTGKSTYAKSAYPDADWMQYDGKYFSQYTHRDTVIFDDVDLQVWSCDILKQLINHTPMKIRIMRSYQEWNPKLVIILANYWPHRFEVNAAVARRIKFFTMVDYEPKAKT